MTDQKDSGTGANPEQESSEEPQVFAVNMEGGSSNFSRRNFLELTATAVAATALAGCNLSLNNPLGSPPTETEVVLTPTETQQPPSQTPVPPTNTLPPTKTATLVPPTSTPTPTQVSLTAQVIVESANVRFSPSLDQKVLFQMTQGQQVTVMGRTDDGTWVLVNTGMVAKTKKLMIGWMKANQLSLSLDVIRKLPAATPLPTATPLPGQAGPVKPGETGRQYVYTDEYGFDLVYYVPCGAQLPFGATCTCDCVTAPIPSPTPSTTPPCSCNVDIHYWYPN